MSGIQKKFFGGKLILPCQICRKRKSNCNCKYRCPHPSHEKDRNGNPKLRHLCDGCWKVFPQPERVWSEQLQRFVAPNNPSLGSGAQQIAGCVQTTQQSHQEDEELWDEMNAFSGMDGDASAAAANPKPLSIHLLSDKDYWEIMDMVMGDDTGAAAAGAATCADARVGADEGEIITQIIWDYLDNIRRQEELQAGSGEMSPTEAGRLWRLFENSESDNE